MNISEAIITLFYVEAPRWHDWASSWNYEISMKINRQKTCSGKIALDERLRTFWPSFSFDNRWVGPEIREFCSFNDGLHLNFIVSIRYKVRQCIILGRSFGISNDRKICHLYYDVKPSSESFYDFLWKILGMVVWLLVGGMACMIPVAVALWFSAISIHIHRVSIN